MQPIEVLTWVIIVVFSLTALITLGALVENFKWIRIKEVYLKKLFFSLILEIVAVCIPLSADAIKQSSCDRNCMISRINALEPSDPLAEDILKLRDTFSGIFKTPEYNVEISFEELPGKEIAKVCPSSPLYKANVMIFNKSRSGGALVVPVKPAPGLCVDNGPIKIAISKEWAKNDFHLSPDTRKISGWGRVIPPSMEL